MHNEINILLGVALTDRLAPLGDAARLSSTVKSELPGRGKVVKKEGEEWAQKAGAKFDHTVGPSLFTPLSTLAISRHITGSRDKSADFVLPLLRLRIQSKNCMMQRPSSSSMARRLVRIYRGRSMRPTRRLSRRRPRPRAGSQDSSLLATNDPCHSR